MDLLARCHPPHPMATGTGSDRCPVGKAWVAAPGDCRKRSAPLSNIERVLRFHTPPGARHGSVASNARGTSDVSLWIAALPRLLARDAPWPPTGPNLQDGSSRPVT